MGFGKRLRELREKKGLTQEVLGKMINQTKANISKYENEKIEPSLEIIDFLAEYFKVSADYLLGRSESLKRNEIKNAPGHNPEPADKHPQSIEAQIMSMLRMDNDLTEEEKRILAEDMAGYFEYRKAKLRN